MQVALWLCIKLKSNRKCEYEATSVNVSVEQELVKVENLPAFGSAGDK